MEPQLVQSNQLGRRVVRDFDYNDEGTYNITLLDVPDGPLSCPSDPNGGAITYGETLAGTIDVASDMDAFQFTGQLHVRVFISVEKTSGSLEPSINLYPPDGGPYEAFGSGTIDHRLQQSGLYTIVVYDLGCNDEGTYNITLQAPAYADFEPDGDVDYVDLAELVSHWLGNEASVDIAPPEGDGQIDFGDFAELAEHWLEGTTP